MMSRNTNSALSCEQDKDLSRELLSIVETAIQSKTAIRICGGDSKQFYGRNGGGDTVHVAAHRGIIKYDPRELVITARAGTPLSEIEAALDAQGQMLPFEPPHFGDTATLGGTIACGLSGPRRPYTGAARDFVLGVTLINGVGKILRFGGDVMKNVAGYDVSRLQVGAMGTLGLLLDISLKVLPKPAQETTISDEMAPDEAIETMNRLAGRPLPLSGACYDGNRLHLRLSGTDNAIREAVSKLGGEPLHDSESFWAGLREHKHRFFSHESPLWRLSVPSTTAPLPLAGHWMIDWGGGLRWLHSDLPASEIRNQTLRAGGHATLFRGRGTDEVFHPLPSALMKLHRNLKAAFDPQGIFNPQRIYPNL